MSRVESRPRRSHRAAAALFVAGLGAVGACGQSESLVGGPCAVGYVDCNDQCVAVASDPTNCGACGRVCTTTACVDGVCMDLPDGEPEGGRPVRDASRDTFGGWEAGPVDAGRNDASPRDERDAESRDATRPPADAAHHDDAGRTPPEAGLSEGGQRDAARVDAPRSDAHPRDAVTTDSPEADASRPDGGVDGRTDAGRASDATTSEGATDDAGAADTLSQDATSVDATLSEGGSGGSVDAADARVDGAPDACARPYTTTANCGACGVACSADQVCSPRLVIDQDVSPFICVDQCASPYHACRGTCVDNASDPMNCGHCGKTCASGICSQGTCAGSSSGDIVVVGHDYASAPVRVSEATLLANAVFLPPANPLRVLSFEQYADPTQVANVKAVVAASAQALGRTVQLTPVMQAAAVPADLDVSTFDVLLVYDQADAPRATLGALGASWATSLASFLVAGGDVVVLDGASGAHPQMAAFLSTAGLLEISGEVPITSGEQLLVVASGDAVGNNVVSPYAAQDETVALVTSEANGGSVTYVVDYVSDGGLVPVVIHKTVRP